MSLRGLKKSYDRKVLETFDVIGCYFIDLFYNDLFLKSKHVFTTGHSKSLTETYRSHVVWFMRGIAEKPKNYIEVMKKLLDYYNKETKTITSTLSELENKILCQFIPSEYYQDFTNTNKEKVLHDIIIKAINQLAEVVLEPSMLGKIIDDHLNPSNVQLLQEKLTDVFIVQREEYYSKFVDEISKANGNKTVSIDQFKKLKAEYASELKRRITAESERDRAVSLLEVSLNKIAELESISGGVSQHVNNQVVQQTTPQRITQHYNNPVAKPLNSNQVSQPTTPQRVTPQRTTPQQTRIKTPVRSPVKNSVHVNSPQKTTLRPITTIDDVGLKLSELSIGDSLMDAQDNTHDDTNVNRDDSGVNRVDTNDTNDTNDDNAHENSSNSGDNSGDNSSNNSSSDDEDSEEIHKKQRKALLEKRRTEIAASLDDDPGFGN